MFEQITGVEQAFGIKIPLSLTMRDAMILWNKMYVDKAPWKYYKYGDDKNVCERSLKIPSSVASELARLTTLEMKAEITGSDRADYLNQQFQKFVIPNIRQAAEYATAFGGVVFKPYVTESGIAVAIIPQGRFYPVSFTGNDINAAVFSSEFQSGDTRYTRLEFHRTFERNGTLHSDIQNKCFAQQVSTSSSQSDSCHLGTEIQLSDVPEWKDIEADVRIDKVKHPLFSYFKMPFANTIDTHSPLGVSCYSRAVDQIRLADQQLNRLEWEYVSTESAVYVDNDFLEQDDYGNPKPLKKTEERLYRTYSGDTGNSSKEPITIYSPQIRHESLMEGIDFYKREIEFQCGLAYGTLSNPQSVEKTAEEVKQAKQRSYSTVKDIQTALDTALRNLIDAMDDIASLYELAPEGEYEFRCDWDDGIVVDRSKWFSEMLSLVGANLVKPEVFVAEYFGCTEEEALDKYMPKPEIDNEEPDNEE